MANPSSSHHGERHHHRSERSSHHHHRTISSTTLLLVLSLVLAVLAVMLSLPSSQSGRDPAADPAATGVWSLLTPKRTQALIAREGAVAVREAEVARREADLLVGAPGGVVQTPQSCPPCTVSHTVETVTAPVQTIIKEVVKEDSLTPPGWTNARVEDILDRELKIAERERDISKREESVNRREHDASRRESWIMEQLIALGNDGPQVEEEYVYGPPGSKPKAKYHELPPLIVSDHFEPQTKTVVHTQTVTVPSPAGTRRAASPTPVFVASPSTSESPRTTTVEIITEEEVDSSDSMRTVTVTRGSNNRRPPKRWFGGW